jgi:hypothetical protein
VQVAGVWHSVLTWALATRAEFWTAVFTGLLTLFTLGLLGAASATAILGLRSLRMAAASLRLEAAPYLVVTAEENPSVLAGTADRQRYVITGQDNGRVPRLRLYNVELDNPKAGPVGATMARHHGGAPNWPFRVLAIKNVGRSPGVNLRIDATFHFVVPDNMNYENIAQDKLNGDPNYSQWLVGRDYPFEAKGSEGFGTIEISWILSGETKYLVIENRFAANIYLDIAKSGTSALLSPTESVEIPVAVPTESIEIRY